MTPEAIDPQPSAVRSVVLAGATDFAGFRAACRALWAAQAEPESVDWRTADDAEGDLFCDPAAQPGEVASSRAGAPGGATETSSLRIPPRLMPAIESAALHRDPGRFALLYRLVWRLQSEPHLRGDALDADVVHVQQMAQAVRRDMHKMKAFVRFRTVEEDARLGPLATTLPHDITESLATYDANAAAEVEAEGDLGAEAPAAPQGDGALHVAWFEPEHHVVEATAPFFARRFTSMRWAILTPERSVEWDGGRLVFGPGARRDQAPPADAGEQLWLTYYESIFNPARLKVAMMKREMPVRYWKNLPEAPLIGGLVAHANERSARMVDRPPTEPSPRRAVAPAAAAAARTSRPAAADAEPAGLDALAAALDRCRECPIGEHATQAVPGEGGAKPRLMFVGEQPGDVEDLRGHPFVGPAGQLFDRALAQLGIDRRDTWVTNAVKHFKFELRGKRRIHKTPAQQEAAACLHWLESEIGLVDPGAIVALGATAARQLMGSPVAVTRQRGEWLRRSDGRRVLITLHPSALLRMDAEHRDAAWQAWLADLQHAADAMREPPPR